MAWISKIGTIKTVTMSDAERQNNATLFYGYFKPLGFTLESVCGMLGNIERESWINPGMKQGTSTALGWGLIQWTPSTDLTDWCAKNKYAWNDGTAQCMLINSEGNNEAGVNGRWLPTKEYPYTWQQFSQLSNYEIATKAFLYERERAGIEELAERLANAKKWYQYLSGVTPPIPPSPTPQKRKKMPIYMMVRRIY